MNYRRFNIRFIPMHSICERNYHKGSKRQRIQSYPCTHICTLVLCVAVVLVIVVIWPSATTFCLIITTINDYLTYQDLAQQGKLRNWLIGRGSIIGNWHSPLELFYSQGKKLRKKERNNSPKNCTFFNAVTCKFCQWLVAASTSIRQSHSFPSLTFPFSTEPN